MLKAAKKAGDTQLVLRIIKEQKNRGTRNKRKKRGSYNNHVFLVILLIEAIRRFLKNND